MTVTGFNFSVVYSSIIIIFNMKLDLTSEQKYLIGGFLASALVFTSLFWLVLSQWPALEVEQYAQDELEDWGAFGDYLRTEEVIFIQSEDGDDEPELVSVQPTLFEYIEVIDSCGPYFEGDCLNVRSGPGTDFPVITRLRQGQVLKVGGSAEREGEVWYKVVFDEWIRYPERLSGDDWYVTAEYVKVLLDEGVKDISSETINEADKRIVVSRTEQMLYAYEGDELFMEESISTGVELTPTPRGEFRIFRKTPTRYMQGPLPGISSQYWDLPGVPWNLYFTHQGAIIHGTYWHDDFGQPSSNGCVNIRTDRAKELYRWADLGTRVIVRD